MGNSNEPVDRAAEKNRSHTQDDVRVHLWDWKSQPDWSWLVGYQAEGFMWIQEVPSTGMDEYAIFCARTPISTGQAQKLWDAWDWGYEEDAGRA